MKNLKVYKTRVAAFALATTTFLSAIGLAGCNKRDEGVESINSSIVAMVDNVEDKIDEILPESSDEIVDNASIMLLLDLIAKEDENGKISADVISNLKNKLDVDDMMNEFNSFLDMISNKIRKTDKVKKISEVLPEDLKNDKVFLSNIETILENIIKYSKEENKDEVVNEFNKIYTLFVEEKEIEMNGIKFEIRDLTFPIRAVANNYAETAAFYAKDYISEEQYSNVDKRTNDQNNKAYIKSKLEILSNQMEEKSEVDVITVFNKKYEEVSKLLGGKVNLSNETIKNIVNYMNLKYIDSDKVSTKDMITIVGEYDDDKVSDAILGIEAINTYNFNNQNAIIPFSSFFVDEYLKTETGKTDSIALNYVQFNTINLNNSVTTKTDYKELSNNPYFKNVYVYFTKQDFNHKTKDGDNEVVWQQISDGANFVNYLVILNSLNRLPKVENKDNYVNITQENLGQSIQYIQNTIIGECKKIDAKQYIK